LVHLFLDHVIDPHTSHQRLFFDSQWNSLSDTISYGHDIEASWLLLEAAEALGDPALLAQVRSNAVRMAQAVYDQGLGPDGSMLYETIPSEHRDDGARHWWVHAEAVVGFYNAYQLSGQAHFATAAGQVWNYIQAHFVDRQNGDWFKVLNPQGAPYLRHDKVGPWECPYHHARLCYEMIRKLS
jgi:mannobiose 2-epimerase